MRKHFVAVLFLFIGWMFHTSFAQQPVYKGPARVTIRSESKMDIYPDSLDYQEIYLFDNNKTLSGKTVNAAMQFTFPEDKPVLVSLSDFFPAFRSRPLYGWVLLEPNDDLTIYMVGGQTIFYGQGAEKIKLLTAFYEGHKNLTAPLNKRGSLVVDMDDFWSWNKYIDQQEQLVIDIAKRWNKDISAFAQTYIKSQLLSRFEYERVLRFGIIRAQPDKYNLNTNSLKQIFDGIFAGEHSKWLLDYAGPTFYAYNYFEYVRQLTLRQHHFNLQDENLKGVKQLVAYYNTAKKVYTGNALANCLTFLITSRGIKEFTYKKGYVEEFEQLLARYYRENSDFPEHVKYVQDYDLKYHRFLLGIRDRGYNFNLTDISGNRQSRESYGGRLLLLNFWNPEAPLSTQTAKALAKVAKEVGDKSKLAVVNISAQRDKCKWLAEIKRYGLAGLTNLFTNGNGENDPVFKGYGVLGYPRIVLLDENGQSMFNSNNSYALKMHSGPILPDPLKDEGAGLVDAIRLWFAQLNDGPYVFSKDGRKTAYWIVSNGLKDSVINQFKVNTDQEGKQFPVALQHSAEIPVSEIASGSKILALSDIEGNFDKFRLLLQNNKIIDTAYNWTFGNGHLVFSGDMFDRGKQVTECLWLIYSLEEKAKASGGQVHFILGNHEIMNLQGDHRYVDEKYKRNAEKLDKTLTELYGKNSELGRWLRTKNIVEKIGNLLFVHGGLSPQINASSMTVPDMNRLARPYYDRKKDDYGDANTNLVMSQTYGPFWYRGYYDPKVNAGAAVDSILTKYDAKHIVTGHTIVADTISVLYGNKVINTDVPHAKGNSEALLIEGRNFYRVNDKGERFLLFKED